MSKSEEQNTDEKTTGAKATSFRDIINAAPPGKQARDEYFEQATGAPSTFTVIKLVEYERANKK